MVATAERPGIVLGFRFAARTREIYGTKYELFGPLDRPDAALVTPEMAAKARALVTVGSLPVDDALLAALPHVRLVCCYGTGYERVDLAAAKRRGVAVTHSPGANAPDVADMAMALLLSSTRNVARADRVLRAGNWKHRVSGSFGIPAGLGGGKLGILGLGAIGELIARRARGFDMEIGYHNRRRRDDVDYRYLDSAMALAEWCDYLMVACRADASNRHTVDAELLRALGPRGHVVNISRGSMVDEAALADALEGGVIEGAGLDVFENEPAIHPKLMVQERVVLTPHLGGGTDRAVAAMTDMVMRNLEAHFAGRPLVSPVPMP